ncbi:MAG: hypothetical protein U0105_27405 [Candidatus Obscuribacterales bacterium]|jgi:hypothetical protein
MALLEFIKAEITKSEVIDRDEMIAFENDETMKRLWRKSAQVIVDDFHAMEEFAIPKN